MPSGKSKIIATNKEGLFSYKILEICQAGLVLTGPEVKAAKFIIWNGPLGKFEEGFRKSTEVLAKAIARSGAEYRGKQDFRAWRSAIQ